MRVLAISTESDAGPGVFAEPITSASHEIDVWRPGETEEAPRDPLSYDALLPLGGPMAPDSDGEHPWLAAERVLLREHLTRETPILAVCLGAQLLAQAAGGAAIRSSTPEIGWFEVTLTDEAADDGLLGPLPASFEAFQWHSYECRLPDDAVILARSPVCIQAFRLGTSAWGIQFHAEVTPPAALRAIDKRGDRLAAIGVDAGRLTAETHANIAAFNRLGRQLCLNWLDAWS